MATAVVVVTNPMPQKAVCEFSSLVLRAAQELERRFRAHLHQPWGITAVSSIDDLVCGWRAPEWRLEFGPEAVTNHLGGLAVGVG